MLSITFHWQLSQIPERAVKKHCKMCGKLSVFTDTNVRRHNANGKNIYQYAIYKCEKNHTWNQKLAIYKTFSEHTAEIEEQKEESSIMPAISIISLAEQGIKVIHIVLDNVIGKHRIDKVLANQIEDWSRSQIIKKIEKGTIQLNEQVIKPSSRLSKRDRISIFID
ncbi:S4 domain-containing protein [Aneurinibacillus migulanus]|uniref:S4 domain-containing protein n=1 Tax=Aneurinibacillus migulanus TaxID=47500 RepID=UPI002E246968|nr:S4 domain-containing protein [Aneurinibacillus migulanus]MED4728575.1 S4 domain-containing protein [Aneurinibacillus migulanus]